MSNIQANIHMPMWAKVALGVILTPIVVVVLLAVALYLPPVQKWAVDKASEYASRETGMEISVGGVHLAFPLDLSLEEVKCLKQNDSLPQVKDTILLVKQAVVDVQLLPLLNSNVVINQIELNQGHFNTSDFIHEARVKGYVGRLLVDNTPPPVASVALDSSVVRLSSIILTDARVNVELSDTVPPDTTETENLWKIYVRDLSIQNSKVTVHMPGDTLQVGAMLADAKAKEGYFDLNKGLYQVNHLALAKSAITYDNNFERRLPYSTNYLDAFDANHIALSDITLKVDSIYYCDPADIRLKIREAAMKEKCGLTLTSLKADIAMDSTKLKVDGALATQNSNAKLSVRINGNGNKGQGDKGQGDKGVYDDLFDFDNNRIEAKVDGTIGYQDLKMIVGSNVRNMPMYPLSVKGEVNGNMKQMTIREMSVNWPTVLTA
ncbi:MAG: phage tail protein, partial [Prevotella sp.]|nr:phage tail protein [Prevotella sp.]